MMVDSYNVSLTWIKAMVNYDGEWWLIVVNSS